MVLLGKLTPKLRKHLHSSIIFVGSIWGETGASYEAAYSAAKGAQHAFVKAYAKEVAHAENYGKCGCSRIYRYKNEYPCGKRSSSRLF